MSNRLAHETSPYLRQHANNPVDWYPWGDEALSRARSEDKPILLSIGYSACHWCHVMEHESFENPQIAQLMNDNFINIKVDREERPDLDHIYQNVSQLMTRSGGWPLTVFLTPELKPYFGGTYFPPEDRYGRPGFPKVLNALAQAYKTDRGNVAENAKRLTEALQQIDKQRVPEQTRPTAAALRKCADGMLAGMDWRNGGFGGAPKFPNTMSLTFLWRYGAAAGFGMAQEAVTFTLAKMARSGLYDQLGGGFHRYSVDERWAVPHFEKMLYDNALLLKLYAEVLLTNAELSAGDRELFTQVLADTTRYVLREMTMPDGGFYSTQDADSEGMEGKFFVWDPRALRESLTETEAKAFELRYGVSAEGNFEHTQQTVLFIDRQVADIARTLHLPEKEVETLLASARDKLFQAREKRVHPGRDEKILASWNGLMISGLAWAARALRAAGRGELGEQALEAATVAIDFVRGEMHHENNRLWSVYKDGKPRFNAYLDDYAFNALAALDLARTLEDDSEIDGLLAQARAWVDVALKHFKDPDGGFFFTSDDHETLISRPKNMYDQAIPAGNSVLATCLVALGELVEGGGYDTAADELLYKFFPTVEKVPMGLGELACASLLYVQGPVTVAGREAEKACVHPNVFRKSSPKGVKESGGAPATHELLVCHRRVCSLPLTSLEAARKEALAKIALK